MRLAGVVILYHPTASAIQNILSWLPEVDMLYIFDNTATPLLEIISNFKNNPKIVYCNDGENKGIAFRLNQAATLAITHNFNWLLTMDQDSFFEGCILSNYKTCIDNYEEFEFVAMFGVEFEGVKIAETTKCRSIEVRHLITSGSVLNLGLFNRVGNFDENYFIDCVDTEYCFRAINMGFKIIKFQEIYLQHSLGEIKYFRSLLTLKLTPRTFHSPMRLYYMVRNFLMLSASYNGKFDYDLGIIKRSILIRIKNVFLYSNERLLLVRCIYKALKDFRNKRLGKYS